MKKLDKNAKIILLHHSTGNCVWKGGVPQWFDNYNADNNTNYQISESPFPKDKPYGWANYPFDYWNIWVNNAGDQPFNEEPTLEILTKEYDVIIFKHCFPVSHIQPDTDPADITSDAKTLANYKLQYNALKEKMHQFPDTRFIVWTPAALVKSKTNAEEGERTKQFTDWVKNDWNQPSDNIFIWDFHALETDDGLYLTIPNAVDENNSHPNEAFSKKAAPSLCKTIIQAIKT